MNKILKITIAVMLIVLFVSSFVEKKNGETHLNDMNCIALLELAADYAYSKNQKDKYDEFKKKKFDIYQSYPDGHLLSNQIVRNKIKHKARLKKSGEEYLNSALFNCGFSEKFGANYGFIKPKDR